MSDKWRDKLKTGAGLNALRDTQGGNLADGLIGRVLGEYRIEKLLGEGGMGKVFLASRIDGSFDRDVAIKISPTSVLGDELRSRALQEQAVLAGLNHPNICQLYDAGATDEGWPYLIMEYIVGTPINVYCRDNDFSHEQTVRLFLSIVDAVVYAHSRLIVHRDIKPGNTLVTADGQPKLLDFGIAKLLETGDGELTRESRPLSPRFASPEQLLGREITTASDIYQLGALLAELLAGQPFLPDETLEHAITRAAQGRPVNLNSEEWKQVPHELRRIAEQCLVPDPAERYTSASALKADLVDYLDGFPVRAVGQSTAYRLRKFARRNRVVLSLAAVTITSVIGLSAWYTMSLAAARDRAETEAANARQVSDFLIGVFAAANPNVAGRPDTTVRQALDEQAEKIDTELDGQPQTQARLMTTVAQAYQKLGSFNDGLKWATRAVELSESSPSLAAHHRFDAQSIQISLLFDLARYDELEAIIDNHVAETEAAFGAQSEQALTARNRLATLYGYRSDFETSIPMYREIYADCIRYLGPTHTLTLKLAGNLAAFLQYSGSPKEALDVTQQAYAAASAELPKTNEQVLALLFNMASAHNSIGNHQQSLRHFEDYRDRVREFYGADSYQVMLARQGLGVAHSELGNFAEAAEIQSALADQQAELFGPDHPNTLSTRQNFANTITQLGRVEEALSILDDVLTRQLSTLGAEDYRTLSARVAIVDALFAAGDDSAEKAFDEAHDLVSSLLGEEHYLMMQLEEIAALYLDEESPTR